LFIDI